MDPQAAPPSPPPQRTDRTLDGALLAQEERIRLRRSRKRWRWAAVIAVIVALVALVSHAGGGGAALGPHIARHDLSGVIFEDPRRTELLQEIREDDSAKALILRINSPGGTVTGSEAIYEALRDIAEEKPVVAVMGEAAASGGYISAIAADHIIARGGTITASIGVIFQAPNFHGLMETLGVKMVEIKSGEQKAEPSPFQPLDEAELQAERALVADSFDWFLGLVKERRKLDDNALALVADGRILTGRQALELGLVDALGGEEEARAWLTAQGVDEGLEIVEREMEEEDPSLMSLIFGKAGLAALKAPLERASHGALMSVMR